MTDTGLLRVDLRGPVGAFPLAAVFTVPAQGVTVLFGPSGCGKTTVLRSVAGLHRMKQGHVEFAGEVWQNDTLFRPPHERPIGYVFQDASLFAHLNVRKNLLFGAPRSRSSGMPHRFGFDDVVGLLGIGHLLDRAPHNLSGGERQRVAIGRALLSQPRLLLMDEPLSALEEAMKGEILPFLERLEGAFELPIVYVTHDVREVERLASHLVLMRSGRVLATGTFAAIQSDPSLPFAASRDAAVMLDGTSGDYDAAYGLGEIQVPGGRFLVPSPPSPPGEPRRLRIAAADVSLALQAPTATTILNVNPGIVVSGTAVTPHEILVVVGLGEAGSGSRLLARVTRRSWDELALGEGSPVHVQVKGVALAPRDGIKDDPIPLQA